MQLSKLEIKGFKSFGDKVVVNFDDGITGIVGPNGCGKSNIVDAIRWVLGEQKTKALRSDKMENIIFNGTKKRKALQMAEVALTFNNTKNLLPTEYSTVTITRRYYRSGDSEYLLNNVTCRLKDITNLFLDTGIGSDSYAIIELKMVDDLLNDKDNSRRNLFEEAAGVSKFKIRKKQTLKKLDDTDKDLERVEDILFEIEKNMKSLERQAKQAERYLNIKEEYKLYSVQLAKVSLEKEKERYQKLTKRIEETGDKKTDFQKIISQKEANVEKLKADLITREKLLASRQKTLNEHVNKIRQYESDKKIKSERLRYLTDKSTNLNEQISQDKLMLERVHVETNGLLEEKESAEKILAEIELNMSNLEQDKIQQKDKTLKIQEEYNVLNNRYREHQEEVYQLRKSLEVNEIQLNNLKQELDKLATNNSQQSFSITEITSELKELANKLKVDQAKLDKLQKEEENNKKQIESCEVEIEKIRQELSVLNRELDSKENEYNLTKSLVDNLEGFPEAIKFLKKNSSWGEDAVLLSDIVTCDEKYRVAIENFLEAVMSYYVVDDYSQAYQAVKLLSESSKGRANFFVMKSFDKMKFSKMNTIKECIPALDIVEFDDKYKNLVNYLLKDVYVSESEVLPEDRTEVFISLNGKITKKSHSISGGSVGLFEGKKIGRAKNLEKLQVEIKKLTDKRDKIKVNLDRKQTEHFEWKSKKTKQEIEEARTVLNSTNEQYISIKLKKEQVESLIENNSTKKEDIVQNVRILEDGLKKSRPKVDIQEIELNNISDQIKQLSTELEEQNEILTQKTTIFNQENIHKHQQLNRVQSIDQEMQYKKNTKETSVHRIEKNNVDLQTTDTEIKGLAESSDTQDDKLLAFYEEKESIEEGVNEAEKEYYKTRNDISEAEVLVKETQSKREEIDESIMETQNKLNETKLSLASIKERLSVEFNVNIDQLLLDNDDEGEEVDDKTKSKVEALSELELHTKVETTKNRLNNIGPINPMAVEAYDEIKERHDFITTQRKDLTDAKNSLLATIKEIDQVAQESFLEAFNEIKGHFINVFRSLFTDEDKCDLRLADPSNPLESAIEIMAQPKGKRPLTINQLSGGEKTLTAVALLFSIYLIKPAPFCIFDEVDAPLDDANIDKFNNIIREFSKDSQFIIVTHNKRTMSTTDIIYGVTMQEMGVSKLVPVDLRSLE